MLDLVLDFEKAAVYLHCLVLVVPGIVMVLLGLFLWLMGSLRPKVFACFFAVVAGYAFKVNLVGILVLAVFGIAVGAIISKKMLAVAAAITAVFVSFLAIYGLGLQEFPALNRYYDIPAQQLNLADSFELLQNWSSFAFTETATIVKSMNAMSIGIVAGAGVIVLIIGIFLPKVISALACSFWGVYLVAKGMSALLLYKGTFVATRVNGNINFFLIVFGSMVFFGTIVQLLLCPARFRKAKNADEKDQDGDGK